MTMQNLFFVSVWFGLVPSAAAYLFIVGCWEILLEASHYLSSYEHPLHSVLLFLFPVPLSVLVSRFPTVGRYPPSPALG